MILFLGTENILVMTVSGRVIQQALTIVMFKCKFCNNKGNKNAI